MHITKRDATSKASILPALLPPYRLSFYFIVPIFLLPFAFALFPRDVPPPTCRVLLLDVAFLQKVILDGNFIHGCISSKVDIQQRLASVLQVRACTCRGRGLKCLRYELARTSFNSSQGLKPLETVVHSVVFLPFCLASTHQHRERLRL